MARLNVGIGRAEFLSFSPENWGRAGDGCSVCFLRMHFGELEMEAWVRWCINMGCKKVGHEEEWGKVRLWMSMI